ncbi:MAG: hypothetical protein WDN45_13945 [Caulobacteraceae bacterium]
MTTVDLERPHGGVAHEHFLPSGPFRHPAPDPEPGEPGVDRGDRPGQGADGGLDPSLPGPISTAVSASSWQGDRSGQPPSTIPWPWSWPNA